MKIGFLETRKVKFFLLCLVCCALFVQCRSGKYFADFRTDRSRIGTLTLLTPYIRVEYFKNQEIFNDQELEKILMEQISANTYSILERKYQPTNLEIDFDVINPYDLSNMFSLLDSSDKNTEVPIPLSIQNQIKNDSNRYSLMVFFLGRYNDHFQPNHNLKRALATNRIYLNPPRNLVNSEIRVVIFDNKKDIIVYHNRKNPRNADPRIPSMVKKMTFDALRPVYYF